MTKFTLTALFAFSFSFFISAQSLIWTDLGIQKRDNQQIVPDAYRSMSVDFASLKALLLAAPPEGTSVRDSQYEIQLPTPDGGNASFKIVEESAMEPGLQSRFPNIRTFIGIGTGEYKNAQISLDFTLKGFHAQILIKGNSYYIDPLSPDDLSTYIIYTRESFYKSNTKIMSSCEPENIGVPQPSNIGNPNGQDTDGEFEINFPQASNGTQLRTYQLALACTGEYAQFHGGTVPLVLSAMTTTMNRVNGIYRRDLCLRMLLISNTDDLIFLNPVTDGYTNSSTASMISQNQVKTNAIIGSSNYDIGHVFSTISSGLASLGVVCNNNLKARGVSGQASPIGDPFDVDYVAHEMGHQWNATHTQNNSCNRTASSAYEPGSGSTIMAYAGICPPNLQSNSDAHFHNHSYNQIRTFSVNGSGNSCATITSAVNSPPNLTIPSGGFHIPKSTPFELTISAIDPNLDPMTYCWEQYDLGPATAPGDINLINPSGNAPIFRSWPPSNSPTRVFPRISDLVNNTTVIGEKLPTYARDLTFRCTVRDNYINGAVNDAQIGFDVAGNSGPFLVTSPNISTTWIAGTTKTITWNVANTTASPVSCSNVSIYLSTDGGFTYPITLIASTANDGSASITVPDIETSQARIKVKGNGNIFFDISNQNFTILEETEIPVNNAICAATNINCGDNLSGSSVNATESSLGEPSCTSGTENDVFYSFNAVQGNTYVISVNGTNYDAVLAIYTATSCTGTMTELDCTDQGLSDNIAETITYTADENQTIFIQTYDYNSSAGDFNITLDCTFANDDICDAQPITCGETVFGLTVGATVSTLGIPSCGGGTAADVFYSLEAEAGVEYEITVDGSNYDGVLAAYTGNCSGVLTEIACADEGVNVGVLETINFTVATSGTVYIQTYDWFSNGGQFELQVVCTNVPFDEPCQAYNLSCGESFSGSSAGATQSSIDSPSCSGGSQKDVFFKFQAVADVEYSITVDGDTYDGVLAAYTGNCNGILTELECADNGLEAGIAETINVSVSTDQTIYLQVYDYATFGASDFNITLNCPIPDNDDCADAISLTVNNPGQCPGNQVEGTTYGASSSSPDACEDTSPDVYYSFSSGNSSELIINLNAISATDLVISLLASSCSSQSISCDIGVNQSNQISVTPFTTYYVRIHSISQGSSGSFNICIEKVAPNLATVGGSVTGWNSGCSSRPMVVSLANVSTTDSYLGINSTLNSDGSFSLSGVDIIPGTYDILVNVNGALAKLVTNVVLSSGANTINVDAVTLGDINNNNFVNITDYSLMSAAFGSVNGDSNFNPLADLNCNGVVNVTDLSILGLAFGAAGDGLPL